MSPLPRLAAPRGLSQRTAAMLARAPAQLDLPLTPALRCARCRSPSPDRPRVTPRWCAVCVEGQRRADERRGRTRPAHDTQGRRGRPPTASAPSQLMRGPILLQTAPAGATGEQRIGDCPREARCVEDWLAQGRQGQARCPAGCGVWRAVGPALDGDL